MNPRRCFPPGLFALRPLVLAVAAVGALALPAASGATPEHPGSDPAAVALAEKTLEKMGGREAWSRLRYLEWDFLGKRHHVWDRWTGDERIESEHRIVLMNIHTKKGRVWEDGKEITDPDALRKALDLGYAWWVNDSYWLIMPVKLLDPGARLHSLGEGKLEDGRPADVIEVTFDPGTGLTPENKYRVWIGRDSGLVEQWSYYPTADGEPSFTLPWKGWKRFDEVLICTDHGRGADWNVATPTSLPDSVFDVP